MIKRTKEAQDYFDSIFSKYIKLENIYFHIIWADTEEEEFWYYLPVNEKIRIYIFYDSENGYGIGTDYINRKYAVVEYTKELGIINKEKEFLANICVDILNGKKIYVENRPENYAIDFTEYIGKQYFENYVNNIKYSIEEISKIY